MKITLVCHDIPYPPMHGGKVDMWRRIKAFAKFNVDLQLICWVNNQPSSQDIAYMHKYVSNIHLIKFPNTPVSCIQRLFDLRKYPLEVTSRIVRGSELTRVLSSVSDFNPNLIWLDGLHGAELAFKIRQFLNIPIFTRSHNIEHLYYQRLLKSAKGIDKFKRFLSLSNLKKYEYFVLRNSELFYDISAEDLAQWENNGLYNGRYLPPMIENIEIENFNLATKKIASQFQEKYEIVFLGNLFSNNNVASIDWFLTQVLPIIRSQIPSIKVLIAGANPVPRVKQICQETQGVELKINPVSVAEIYNSAQVLINPVHTGSGVSIKSIEMLSYGKSIVSTSQGICGLPEIVREYFEIADDPQSFAQKTIDCILNQSVTDTNPELLNKLFGSNRIQEVLHDINTHLKYSALAV